MRWRRANVEVVQKGRWRSMKKGRREEGKGAREDGRFDLR